MNLKDAVKHAEGMLSSAKGRDAVALHVLVEMGHRVLRSKRAVKELAEALGVREAGDLNQTVLFPEGRK